MHRELVTKLTVGPLLAPEVHEPRPLVAQISNVDLSSDCDFDSELQSLGGLSVSDDTAVSSSGVEGELDTNHAPSKFTEPEDDVEQDIQDKMDEGAKEDDEKEGDDPEMVHDGASGFYLPF